MCSGYHQPKCLLPTQVTRVKLRRSPYPPRGHCPRPHTTARSSSSASLCMIAIGSHLTCSMLHYIIPWGHAMARASTWWTMHESMLMPVFIAILQCFALKRYSSGPWAARWHSCALHELLDLLSAYMICCAVNPSWCSAAVLAWGCMLPFSMHLECIMQQLIYLVYSAWRISLSCIWHVMLVLLAVRIPWCRPVHDTIVLGSDLAGNIVKLHLKDASVLQLYLLVCTTLATMYPNAPDHVWENLSLWHNGQWISDQLDATLHDVDVRPGDMVRVCIGRIHKGMLSYCYTCCINSLPAYHMA